MKTKLRVRGTNRYAEMVERCFDVVSKHGDEWMARCPWHDNTGTPAMQVNISTGNYLCFNETCGRQGGPVALSRFCGERASDPSFDIAEMRIRLDMLKNGTLGDSQLEPVDEVTLKRYSFPTDYWRDRGFKDSTIEAFDLGYDPMNNVVTIPIRNRRAELLGVIKRDLDPNTTMKYKYPKGFKKSSELFASWFAEECDHPTIVLVEGSVDAAMCWQAGYPAVAQYGSHISAEQVRMLKRMGFLRVVLFFDNDAAGHSATQAALGESQHTRNGHKIYDYNEETDLRTHFIVSRVAYNKFWPKDPGAMDDVTIGTAISTATPV